MDVRVADGQHQSVATMLIDRLDLLGGHVVHQNAAQLQIASTRGEQKGRHACRVCHRDIGSVLQQIRNDWTVVVVDRVMKRRGASLRLKESVRTHSIHIIHINVPVLNDLFHDLQRAVGRSGSSHLQNRHSILFAKRLQIGSLADFLSQNVYTPGDDLLHQLHAVHGRNLLLSFHVALINRLPVHLVLLTARIDMNKRRSQLDQRNGFGAIPALID